MADISMCRGEGCLRREECYRFLAKPDREWQSYANFEVLCNEESGYEYMYVLVERW